MRSLFVGSFAVFSLVLSACTSPAVGIAPTATQEATEVSTEAPTLAPTDTPTLEPTVAASVTLSPTPTSAPTSTATSAPTQLPTLAATIAPTASGPGVPLFAFVSIRSGSTNLYSMTIDGKDEKPLTQWADPVVYPSWSPDGRRIVFEAASTIYTVNADGSELKNLSQGNHDTLPVWSPDGKSIAFFSSSSGGWELTTFDVQGKNRKTLAGNTAFEGIASWSPDSTRIVYPKWANRNAAPEIWVVNADGTNERPLTNNLVSDNFPTWSPNGSKIAFISSRSGNVDEIFVMNPDGSDKRQITDTSGGNTHPVWSPDGVRIAFVSMRDEPYPQLCNRACNTEIYAMNADGGDVRRLTNSPGSDLNPVWSPDGTKIAFDSDRGGSTNIYVMNAADGSGLVQITQAATDESNPIWQPASR